jgi:hypothetical protein
LAAGRLVEQPCGEAIVLARIDSRRAAFWVMVETHGTDDQLMLKIYVSSTFIDLREHRSAVQLTIRKLGHHDVAMENYAADERRPLDKCLADVAACDVYVGIFAWRYGYVPETDNPQKQSITEREYRQAIQSKKPCLIFLVDEDAAWPPGSMDAFTKEGDEGKQIAAFRKTLSAEHCVEFFNTTEQLATVVGIAFHNLDISDRRNDRKSSTDPRAALPVPTRRSRPARTLGERTTIVFGVLLCILAAVVLADRMFVDALALRLSGGVVPAGVARSVVALGLVLIGVLLFIKGLTRRSRLLDPACLLLRAENPRHLKGREQVRVDLARLCQEFPLVHVVGESGAGKTALMQAGVCPDLKRAGRVLPIYMDVWGTDWEKGPRSALADALWHALSIGERGDLGLPHPPKPSEIASSLRRIRRVLSRIPLIIFDQFDDYQARHPERFRAFPDRTWISARELIKANRFWRTIKFKVAAGTVRCVFVTRADSHDGLISVMFGEPRVYRLERLPAAFVRPLLDELTDDGQNGPVVSDPRGGWDDLKGRLVRDLSRGDEVLPVQLKVALQGLAAWDSPLTEADYDRAGGLRGLEAAFIGRHVDNAVRYSELERSQVIDLLMALVDETAKRTNQKTQSALVDRVFPDGSKEPTDAARAIRSALDDLEQKEVIRRRIDPDTGGTAWLLDHDYLSHGVIACRDQAAYWAVLLQKKHEAYKATGRNIWRRFWNLLSIVEQFRLAFHRFVVRRFRYGEHRAFALWSLIRFALPILAIIAFLGARGEYHRWQRNEAARQETALDEEAAKRVLTSLSSETFTSENFEAVWALAAGKNEGVRDRLVALALAEPFYARQFNYRPKIAVQALCGLDRDRRDRLLTQFSTQSQQYRSGFKFSSSDETDRYYAWANLGIQLGAPEADFYRGVFRDILAQEPPGGHRMVRNDNDLLLLVAVTSRVPRDDILGVVKKHLLLLKERESNSGGIGTPAPDGHRSDFRAVVSNVNPEAALAVLEELLSAETRGMSFDITDSLAAVARKLRSEDTVAALRSLIAATSDTSPEMRWEISRITDDLQPLAARVPANEAASVRRLLVDAIRKPAPARRLPGLVLALGALPGGYAAEDVAELHATLVKAIEARDSYLDRVPLFKALLNLKATLSEAECAAVLAQLLVDTTPGFITSAFEEKVEAIALCPGLFRAADADAAITEIKRACTHFSSIRIEYPYSLSNKEQNRRDSIVAGIARKIPLDEAVKGSKRIAESILDTHDVKKIRYLVIALEAMSAQLAPGSSQNLIAHLLNVVEKEEISDGKVLSKELARIAGKTPDTDVPAMLEQLLSVINKREGIAPADVPSRLSEAMAILASRVLPEQASPFRAQLLRSLLERLPFGAGPIEAARARTLWSFKVVPNREEAEAHGKILERFFKGLPRTPLDFAPYPELTVGAIKAFPGKLSPEQTQLLETSIARGSPPDADGVQVDRATTGGLRGHLDKGLGWLMQQFAIGSDRSDAEPKIREIVMRTPAHRMIHELEILLSDSTVGSQRDEFVICATIGALPHQFDVKEYINLMKYPTCVGAIRSAMLSALGAKVSQDFKDDLWGRMVPWAEKSEFHSSLTTPPYRSAAPE